MSLLLDTQILIWLEENPLLIPAAIRDQLANESEVYFSITSVWEIAIKIKIGKLSITAPLPVFVDGVKNDYNFKLLEISLPHIYHTQQLPLHHRYPFDRLLIAQSIVEDIPIISSDAVFDAYGIKRIW